MDNETSKKSAAEAVQSGFLRAREVARFAAAEAVQAVAVDEKHFYAIANQRIGKYGRQSGDLETRWSATKESPLKHLNSGVIMDGRLYCAHSNYPAKPDASSIEIWDTDTLEHVGSRSFGIYEGSLTWIDRHDEAWWAVFAHYTRKGVSKNNRWTSLVKFDEKWRRLSAWTFPQHVLDRFGTNSCSGGFWGDDGLIYCTGHDRGEIYRLSIPKSGSQLRFVDTIKIPITGQGIAFDASRKQIFGINRLFRQVVVSELD